MYLLGYIPAHNKIYLVDKDVNVYAYGLSLAVVEYQTAILRGDIEAASELLGEIPAEHMNKVARFLEVQGVSPRMVAMEAF
jgi:coatomer subunit beta'